MCTVTYIPQNDGFVLTSNRDEAPSRHSNGLTKVIKNGHELIFPKDSGAGGTWIAVSNENKVVCLLNGAFVKHKRNLPYRMSRGIMVLDFFKYASAIDFFENYNFDNIEPFTFIVFDKGELMEFRWNGQKHIKYLDSEESYIWSSATLYPLEIKKIRRKWFADWMQNNDKITPETILEFHKTGGNKDKWNGFVMNRNNIVRTTAITQVVKKKNKTNIRYEDLILNKIDTSFVKLFFY